MERRITNACDTVGDCNAFKFNATRECTITNACDAIGDNYTFKRSATTKSAVFYFHSADRYLVIGNAVYSEKKLVIASRNSSKRYKNKNYKEYCQNYRTKSNNGALLLFCS